MIYIILSISLVVLALFIYSKKKANNNGHNKSSVHLKVKNILGFGEYDSDSDEYGEDIYFTDNNNVLTTDIVNEFNSYYKKKVKSSSNFGVILTKHIKKSGFSGQTELLVKAGIPSSTLNDLINKNSITKKKINLYKIALTLNLSYEDTEELFKSKGFTFCTTSPFELCHLFFIETKFGRKIYSDCLLEELINHYNINL